MHSRCNKNIHVINVSYIYKSISQAKFFSMFNSIVKWKSIHGLWHDIFVSKYIIPQLWIIKTCKTKNKQSSTLSKHGSITLMYLQALWGNALSNFLIFMCSNNISAIFTELTKIIYHFNYVAMTKEHYN